MLSVCMSFFTNQEIEYTSQSRTIGNQEVRKKNNKQGVCIRVPLGLDLHLHEYNSIRLDFTIQSEIFGQKNLTGSKSPNWWKVMY